MRVANADYFLKCMSERGWDADAYLAEVSRKIDERGYFNADFSVHPEENDGYYDEFELVVRGVFNGEVLAVEPIYVFCEISNNK